jgi:hypothetical protein
MSNSYEAVIASGFHEDADLKEPETIRRINRRAAKASWQTLSRQDTESKGFRLPIGKAFWPLSAGERHEIERLFRGERDAPACHRRWRPR